MRSNTYHQKKIQIFVQVMFFVKCKIQQKPHDFYTDRYCENM
jgi:hypothetical protein